MNMRADMHESASGGEKVWLYQLGNTFCDRNSVIRWRLVNEARCNDGVKHNYQWEEQDERGCIIHGSVGLFLD